jgi:hypothetical protein
MRAMIQELFMERNTMSMVTDRLVSLGRGVAMAGVVGILAGCATSYAPSNAMTGLTRDELIAHLGAPDPMPTDLSAATRLDFPRGPYGRHTYAVYFSPEGRMTGFRQILNEENFAMIKPGMSAAEVVALIGISRNTFGLARNRGYVWSYRYITPLCQWFQIEFTQESTVRSTGFGLPPECRPRVPAGF